MAFLNFIRRISLQEPNLPDAALEATVNALEAMLSDPAHSAYPKDFLLNALGQIATYPTSPHITQKAEELFDRFAGEEVEAFLLIAKRGEPILERQEIWEELEGALKRKDDARLAQLVTILFLQAMRFENPGAITRLVRHEHPMIRALFFPYWQNTLGK